MSARIYGNLAIVTGTHHIETKFYGMCEFALEDPDGYVITFAERVPQR